MGLKPNPNFLRNRIICSASSTAPSITVVLYATKPLHLWRPPMENQHLVVLLGYTGETACPKSHKRPRARVGFGLQPPDGSFCARTTSSCSPCASFPSTSSCPHSFFHPRPLAAANTFCFYPVCHPKGCVTPQNIAKTVVIN